MKKWTPGIVDAFDNFSGRGLIRSFEDGKWYFVHYSAIESKDSWKTLELDKEVLFIPSESRDLHVAKVRTVSEKSRTKKKLRRKK